MNTHIDALLLENHRLIFLRQFIGQARWTGIFRPLRNGLMEVDPFD
jgi:hypothetical protein